MVRIMKRKAMASMKWLLNGPSGRIEIKIHFPLLLLLASVALLLMQILLCSCKEKTVKDASRKAGLDFGFAVSVADMADEAHRAFIADNASIIVAENAMKIANLRPNRKFWNWGDVDQLLNFASENKIDAKFHVLFWHRQNSNFVNNIETREDALELMDEHITKVMEHCKGKIKCYDVVNEMFNENGTRRQNVWQRTIGDDYIEHALQKARKADPETKLYLNDYNNENAGEAKADAMYELAKDFVERGVPLDGVGFQLHLDAKQIYNEDAIRANVRRYGDLGLEVSFSEIDVRIPNKNHENYENKQKEVYLSLLKIALEEPNVKSFIMWGLSDKTSWVSGEFGNYGYALPIDADYNPKPVYNEMAEMIKAHKRKK